MITVEEALNRLFEIISPIGTEFVQLQNSGGRVLAKPAGVKRDQPPFATASMDGYAMCADDAISGAVLKIIGEAAAGHRHKGKVARGECIRIFTGAPVPPETDKVVIQEEAIRNGDMITLVDTIEEKSNIRSKGCDFRIGDMLDGPKILTPADVALLAAMNIPVVEVSRQPDVALISTGDELVMPGDVPGPDQIIASNTFGLKTLLDKIGAAPRILPIAKDSHESLAAAFELASDADLIVTIGGASVGDHDLVGEAASRFGMQRAFYKVGMRPGKPLMAGHMENSPMLGLPGNPVSSIVCGLIFLVPVILAMMGLDKKPAQRKCAFLDVDMETNGPREHYMRAIVRDGKIMPQSDQDSSLLSVLANSNALLIRPAGDRPRMKGEIMQYIEM